MRKTKRFLAMFSVVLCLSMLMGMGSVFAKEDEQRTSQDLQKQLYDEFTQQKEYDAQFATTDADVLSPQDSEIIAAFDEFKKSNLQRSQNSETTIEEIEFFANYAISTQMFDQSVTRATVTKAIVRAEFKKAADVGAALGYLIFPTLLKHSLQDSPNTISYSQGSSLSNTLKYSSEYSALVNTIKSELSYVSGTYWTESGSISFNDDFDAKMGIHAADYFVSAQKSGSKWSISIGFQDTYDFDYQTASSDGYSAIITAVNNYGAYAQELNAIVPYHFSVYTVESY